MKITVTQEDIDHGEQRACGSCPVALAIKRAFPDSCFMAVGFVTVQMEGGYKRLPPEVHLFIDAFDSGRLVQPFAFDLA